MVTGVLVLAAGRSTRFGSDKRLAVLPSGDRIIEHTLCTIRKSGLPLRVCLASSDRSLADELDNMGFQTYCCETSVDGMGATLAEGISRLPEWDGVLIALADMPWTAAETFQLVAARLEPARICIPVFEDQRGHPVGFGKRFWPELKMLKGDVGARVVLDAHGESIQEIQVDDPGVVRDVDEPSDL